MHRFGKRKGSFPPRRGSQSLLRYFKVTTKSSSTMSTSTKVPIVKKAQRKVGPEVIDLCTDEDSDDDSGSVEQSDAVHNDFHNNSGSDRSIIRQNTKSSLSVVDTKTITTKKKNSIRLERELHQMSNSDDDFEDSEVCRRAKSSNLLFSSKYLKANRNSQVNHMRSRKSKPEVQTLKSQEMRSNLVKCSDKQNASSKFGSSRSLNEHRTYNPNLSIILNEDVTISLVCSQKTVETVDNSCAEKMHPLTQSNSSQSSKNEKSASRQNCHRRRSLSLSRSGGDKPDESPLVMIPLSNLDENNRLNIKFDLNNSDPGNTNTINNTSMSPVRKLPDHNKNRILHKRHSETSISRRVSLSGSPGSDAMDDKFKEKLKLFECGMTKLLSLKGNNAGKGDSVAAVRVKNTAASLKTPTLGGLNNKPSDLKSCLPSGTKQRLSNDAGSNVKTTNKNDGVNDSDFGSEPESVHQDTFKRVTPNNSSLNLHKSFLNDATSLSRVSQTKLPTSNTKNYAAYNEVKDCTSRIGDISSKTADKLLNTVGKRSRKRSSDLAGTNVCLSEEEKLQDPCTETINNSCNMPKSALLGMKDITVIKVTPNQSKKLVETQKTVFINPCSLSCGSVHSSSTKRKDSKLSDGTKSAEKTTLESSKKEESSTVISSEAVGGFENSVSISSDSPEIVTCGSKFPLTEVLNSTKSENSEQSLALNSKPNENSNTQVTVTDRVNPSDRSSLDISLSSSQSVEIPQAEKSRVIVIDDDDDVQVSPSSSKPQLTPATRTPINEEPPTVPKITPEIASEIKRKVNEKFDKKFSKCKNKNKSSPSLPKTSEALSSSEHGANNADVYNWKDDDTVIIENETKICQTEKYRKSTGQQPPKKPEQAKKCGNKRKTVSDTALNSSSNIQLSPQVSRRPGKFFGSGSTANNVQELISTPPRRSKSPKKKSSQYSPRQIINWSPKRKSTGHKSKSLGTSRMFTVSLHNLLHPNAHSLSRSENINQGNNNNQSASSKQLSHKEILGTQSINNSTEDSITNSQCNIETGDTCRASHESIEKKSLGTTAKRKLFQKETSGLSKPELGPNCASSNISVQRDLLEDPVIHIPSLSSIENVSVREHDYTGRFTVDSSAMSKNSSTRNSIDIPANTVTNVTVHPEGNTTNRNDTTSLSKNEQVQKENNAPYFFRIFMNMLMHVATRQVNWDCWGREELDVIKSFSNLPTNAQKLYVRLFDRSFVWFRRSSIKYLDIDVNLEPTFQTLLKEKFCVSDVEKEDLPTLLELLSVKELHGLCSTFHLPILSKKSLLIKTLVDHGTKQQQLTTSGMQPLTSVIKNKVLGILGNCVKLSEEIRTAFRRMTTLFLTPLFKPGDTSKLSSLYLDELNSLKRTSSITRPLFATRELFLRFIDAHGNQEQLTGLIEQKNWSDAYTYVMKMWPKFLEIVQNDFIRYHDGNLPVFLRRFTAGYILGRMLCSGVDILRRVHLYNDAVKLLRDLLSQDLYVQHRRGQWYDELALILHVHLKKVDQAADIIAEAVREPHIDMTSQVSLADRVHLILQAKKSNLSEQKKNVLNDLLHKLPLLKAFPHCVIEGRSLQRNLPGLKMCYIQEHPDRNESVVSSVEELAISHYRRLGYTEGMHGEGSTIITLFGLFFWDIIYDESVPDVFQNQYQSVPLDLSTPEFYTNRKEAVDKRLKEMEQWTKEHAHEVLDTRWKEHLEEPSIVSWNRFRSTEHVQELVTCLGMKVVTKICEKLAKEYRFSRSGFPDLVVWKPKTFNKYKFVEVKGPNDRLSSNQKVWMHYLSSIGAHAEVCYVKAVGSKKLRKRKSQENSNVTPDKKSKKRLSSA